MNPGWWPANPSGTWDTGVLAASEGTMGETVTVLLAGDVMLGRGVDQILPHPGDPTLHESFVTDARTYVDLAEEINGPVPRPTGVAWPWGDALRVLADEAPEVRLINLETAVTRSDDFAVGKAVHYRMDPDNLPSLTVFRPDVCTLANNHVLDLGVAGLEETLDALAGAGLSTAGAGRHADEAWCPAVAPLPGGGRMLVYAAGFPSSGIPAHWAAADDRPGVAYLAEPSDAAADQLLHRVREHRDPDDLVVVSLHWGSNWGYDVPRDQVRFAHRLIDHGVDVVHGHSSHHPRPIELYGNGLVLYGCGDLVNDYEGITGRERYRGDLRLLYLVTVARNTGTVVEVRMVPMQSRRLALSPASHADAAWLQHTLDRAGRPFRSRIALREDSHLLLHAG